MSEANVVVVAGAGTGKTHALVERYLRTLLGIETGSATTPDKILAITFTEKAASEMRARVQRRLGDLLFKPDNEPTLLEALGSVDVPLVEGLRRSVSGAPIYTFHAFCARVLRDHALAAELDPAFVVLEPDEDRRLLAETAEACVLDALALGSAPVAELIARVALHGFGERKGLVECLVAIHGTLAERGLLANDLACALVDDGAAAVNAAFAAAIAAGNAMKAQAGAGQSAVRCAFTLQAITALRAAWLSRATATVDDDIEAHVSRSFHDVREHAAGNWGGAKLADARRALVAAVDALGAALVDAFTADLAPAVRALLIELDDRQRREKRARGFLAFGDLLVVCRDLLRHNQSVRRRVNERFAAVLVDEYQDTSPVQEEIVALLLSVDGEDKAGRAFIVGDPKQSIYGFRGADSGVFARALDVIARAPRGVRQELAASRRSTPAIVEVANLVASAALPRGAFGVDPSLIVSLTATRAPSTGSAGEHWRVAVAPEPHDDDDDLQVDDGLSPHERESIVVARRLRELFDAGAHQPRDVAILVRRGKAAVPLARALGRVGVAASVVGGDGFYVRPEIADVVAALTLAVDPSDELAVLTVLRSPLVALVDDHVIALYQTLPKQRGLTWPSVLAALTDVELLHETERERVRGFDAVLRTIHARLHGSAFEGGGLARALDAIVDDAGYAASCAVEHDADLRLRNLEKLRALVASSKESALVALARLGDAIDDPPPEPLAALLSPSDDAVRIMTIHQAKGLEFPVVILADAGSGLRSESDDIGCDPLLGLAVTARGRPIAACAQRSGRSGAPTAIQRVRKKLRERNECELARVLYVALTRARDRIYVVGEPRRAGPGSLLGVLEMVRAAHSATFDALLPRVDVKARLEPEQERALPSALTAHSDGAAAMLRAPEPLPAAPRKLRAHDIGRGADAAIERLDDDEQPRLPPRTAGRLAHAIIALVAAEAPELIGDDDTLRIAVENAARACGAHDAPESILGACRATLAHPIQALLDAGASLSFNEPVSLPSGDVVVDGRADLVVRTDDGRVVVVELKLGHEPARVQASIYAAALEHSGAVDVHVALWEVGDRAPAAPAPLDHALVARALDDARAR